MLAHRSPAHACTTRTLLLRSVPNPNRDRSIHRSNHLSFDRSASCSSSRSSCRGCAGRWARGTLRGRHHSCRRPVCSRRGPFRRRASGLRSTQRRSWRRQGAYPFASITSSPFCASILAAVLATCLSHLLSLLFRVCLTSSHPGAPRSAAPHGGFVSAQSHCRFISLG